MENNKILSLYDVANDVEYTATNLQKTTTALDLLLEWLETEGCQPSEKFEDWKAICFAKRFPMYLSALHTVYKNFCRVVDDLEKETDAAYKAYRAQTNEFKK